MRNYLVWILTLLLAGFVVGCGDDDDDADPDGGDTDADTDTDTDADTDTDPVCNAPTGITGWGGPCHGDGDCPSNTSCTMLNGMDTTQGFCSPECCNFQTPDVDYCTDVATGQEGCNIGMTPDEGITWEPPFHCMITCNTAADCPDGSDCVDTGSGTTLICYGYAPVDPDAGPDGSP